MPVDWRRMRIKVEARGLAVPSIVLVQSDIGVGGLIFYLSCSAKLHGQLYYDGCRQKCMTDHDDHGQGIRHWQLLLNLGRRAPCAELSLKIDVQI